MSLFRNTTIAVLMLCCGAVWANGAIAVRQPESVTAGKTLTLADCISLALKNQAAVREAAAQVTNQRGLVNQAKSALLPSTSVSSVTEIANDTRVQGTQIGTRADQLVYDFGRSKSQVKESEHQWEASRAAYVGTNADVILSVKQAYYNLLYKNGLVDVFAKTLKDQEEHVAETQARKNAGVAPLADVLKAQAAAASARVDLVTAQNNANLARVTLSTAMGINIQSPISISETAEPEPASLDQQQLVNLALARRPEVRQSEELVLASAAVIKIARTDNLPSVSTSIGRTQGVGIGESGVPNSWEWLMNVSWSPYDSGFTAGAIKSAKAQLVSAQEALYDTKQSVTQDVVQTRLNVIAADEQVTSTQAEYASAKESLDVAVGRYGAGVGILLDVLDAQSSLLKAESDVLAARYGLSAARAGLEHAIGGAVMGGVSR